MREMVEKGVILYLVYINEPLKSEIRDSVELGIAEQISIFDGYTSSTKEYTNLTSESI